jgi:hypothetical protein
MHKTDARFDVVTEVNTEFVFFFFFFFLVVAACSLKQVDRELFLRPLGEGPS